MKLHLLLSTSAILLSTFAAFGDIKLPPSSGGGGNATVPVDAPIQPPQAFVDALSARVVAGDMGDAAKPLFYDFQSAGITALSPAFIQSSLTSGGVFGYFILNLSDNALTASSVNAILAACVGQAGDFFDGATLNLSGQTPPAPPTGQGLTDKATLISAGWTVTTD